ncbi:MAG: inositol monophosphatase family protein, partial [Candidatus Bathyarchaeota archaeon]
MASHNIEPRWMSVMLESTEIVRTRVRKVLLNKKNLETSELKKLLDDEAQEAIRRTLIEAEIPVQVVSEEGNYEIGEGGPFLVVDPLDGTTNIARGIPFACISMALSETPHISGLVMGLVNDIYSGESYRAERNKGAWSVGKRLTPSKSKQLSEAIISLDISKGAPLEGVERLIKGSGHLRQTGSAALSLCYLAAGIIDAHVDLRGKLRITDAAAGLLILKEAGGVYRIDGGDG